ncbi:UDP-glucuronosyltransferase 2B31-like [Perognathus longimembris pacificus]|uniref:UDP-glucuronosyltransferase 2B31-like n=1 Tax=Perognathus longimembris pacificus TaxID=214514 RepID=UPI002018DD7F|nr:UDP-glucuronosyltransferase 2B31-like [Perognathus longimembris pacificus]
MSTKWISFLLMVPFLCYFSPGRCGKVLVFPMEYSHWINIKTILDELIQRGHEVTVLLPSASVFVDPNESPTIKFEPYTSSLSKSDIEDLSQRCLHQVISGLSQEPFWTYHSRLQEIFRGFSDTVEQVCKDLVLNKEVMTKLRRSKFDAVLADAFAPCGELLAELLKLPLVYTLRFFPGYTYEQHSGGLPVPPSYVPLPMSQLTDHMTFMERVGNMLFLLYSNFWLEVFTVERWDWFYSDVLGRPTTLSETMAKADIWLIRTYWDIEFPRPFLPNFEFVGGLHCKPAKPLPKEMEDFVQSSGDEGVVVFSLGSMVSNVTEERANVIASALAQIPQKVVWKFHGKKPDTLGSNTWLYKWIPQNDLLGHPKTKAFITHGGTNGVYEAIYHGVPMVGIPLFADQPDNIVRLVAKGAAVRLNFHTMTKSDLLNALEAVIYDPFYKENAMRLSRIHHDQPVKPLDRAVFWIEFVMRHKGAKHLRPAVHDLTWLQYHSLDVIAFLLACVAAVTFIFTKGCVLCCRRLAKSERKKHRD